MPNLYTVRFTTRAMTKKYDTKGKLISETRTDTEISYTALPYSTAMSYSGADNFKIEPYVADDRRTAKGTGRDNSVGNGTKHVSRGTYSGETRKAATVANIAHSKVSDAAKSGNLGAALNR